MAEDRRIALAALAVAAVLPIATLIAANMHDNDRIHAELVQSDRAELRRVLDGAADALGVARSRFSDFQTRGERANESSLPALSAQLRLIKRSYNRVAIRLGRRSPVAQRILEARDAGNRFVFSFLEHPKGRSAKSYQDLLRYDRGVERVLDAANLVAHSTTG